MIIGIITYALLWGLEHETIIPTALGFLCGDLVGLLMYSIFVEKDFEEIKRIREDAK